MEKPVYKRVVIKISGEALAGEKKTGFDFDFVTKVCQTVKRCAEMGVETSIVITIKTILISIGICQGYELQSYLPINV